MPGLLIACRDCGAIQRMEPPAQGRVECWRCGRVLESRNGRSLNAGLALSCTTFMLLVIGTIMPVMTVHIAGNTVSTRIVYGLGVAWRQDWGLLTLVLGLVGVVLPLVRFAVLSATLAAIRFGWRSRRVAAAFRICETLDPWAMSDVLLVGAGIGYGRIETSIPVTIEPGGWCFIAAAVATMLTRTAINKQEVWRLLRQPRVSMPAAAVTCTSCDAVAPAEREGGRCPRCSAVLHRRRPDSLIYTRALLLATAVLTPLAYSLPMSALWEAGTPHPHTIIDGIEMLFQYGFWYFGVLIFFISLIFPLTKIIVMSWCLVSIRRHSASRLRTKTRLFRFVHKGGRWSALDPFTVLVFAPMAQFQQLAHVDFMSGSVAFLATVVLSMLATDAFDPRLMWDRAGRNDAQGRAPEPFASPRPQE